MKAALLALVAGTLAGCGTLASWTAPDPAVSVFPHAAGYDAGSAHGAEVLEKGLAVCTDCHTPDDTEAGCAACHADYPHADGFGAGAAHGAPDPGGAWPGETCAGCHGDPALHAGETLTCTGCHPA